jgi:hypothetical protein
MLVTEIWSRQPGKYFCLASRAIGSDAGLTCHWFEEYQFDLVSDKVKELRNGNQVWFCAHGFKKKIRKAKYAEPTHFLYADLDGTHPNTCPIKPTAAVRSSPDRYVGYWYTGEPVGWNINQAWTKKIKADPGGWDPTQVLRVPGSFNHKYKDKPVVKVIWNKDHTIPLRSVVKKLPKGFAKEDVAVTGNDGAAAYKKYAKMMPAKLRQEIASPKQNVADRSEWIWNASLILHEQCGALLEEIVAILWPSGNNKWFDRREGMKRLTRDVTKAISGTFKKMPKKLRDDGEDEEPQERKFFTDSMRDVEEEEIEWLWEPYVAKGELTIVEGDPGVGKSWLMQMLGIATANGDRMPGDTTTRRPAHVCFLDHENSRATIMKPRLRFNGLKREKFFHQDDQTFSVDDEEAIQALYNALSRLKPALVVFDTVMNYAGGANVFSPAETAKMFGTFRHIAMTFKCASVVIRHLNKDSKVRAMYRGQGSITFTGTARTVIGVGYSPDDDKERIFRIVKTNITDPEAISGRKFSLIPVDKQCRFEWGDRISISADQLFATERPKPEDNSQLVKFLTEELESKGRRTEQLILKHAEGRWTKSDLDRVRTAMGVKVEKSKKGPIWVLPE